MTISRKKLSLKWVAFLLILVFIIPVRSFEANSFSQKEDEEFVFEMIEADPLHSYLWGSVGTGDKLKISIMSRNYTEIEGIQYDTLWGLLYKKLAGTSEWILFNPHQMIVGTYNMSYIGRNETFYFIPHSEVITNLTLHTFAENLGFEHIYWTSGIHGYDGLLIAYNGSADGDLNQSRMELAYSESGVLNYSKSFIGNGTAWEQVEFLLFEESPSFPAWAIFLLFIILFLSPIFYKLNERIDKKMYDLPKKRIS
jgi:hypothetical protein